MKKMNRIYRGFDNLLVDGNPFRFKGTAILKNINQSLIFFNQESAGATIDRYGQNQIITYWAK
jgi:hypothetical protein